MHALRGRYTVDVKEFGLRDQYEVCEVSFCQALIVTQTDDRPAAPRPDKTQTG